MNNDLNLKKENNNNIDKLKKDIKEELSKIKQDYNKKIADYKNIYNLNEQLKEIKIHKNEKINNIIDLFTIEYLFFFRILIIKSKPQRIIILQILRNCIEINPSFTTKMIDAMFPIVLCRIFEDSKNSTFEERYECLKLFRTWLILSDNNFPIIFSQTLVSLSKIDDSFKIGCIEFLREISIHRPDICSSVGGFKILINSLLEETIPKNLLNKIICSLIYIINNTNKRKYFNGFGDLYKIFSIFTKSDFSSGATNNVENETKQKKEEIKEENKKLELKLDLAIYVIKAILFTWPGYFLLINDKITFSSLAQSLNNDVNIVIKKSILKLFKEILEDAFTILDNFNIISTEDKDYIYLNKIFLAYILQGLYENHLNESLFNFIEENENNDLRDLAIKIYIKFNILFIKLSNYDIHSPFLKEKMEEIKRYEDLNLENNIKNEDKLNNNINLNYPYTLNNNKNQNMNTRIKLLHLTDKVFHHLNCRDNPLEKIEYLSTEIIIAIHSMLNLDNVKQSWTVNNFYFGAIGNKLFKILIAQDDLSILDSPNEDYIFQKSNSWIKDVMHCMETLLDKNIPEDHPFSIKRIYNSLSRNIFIFLGIISNSNQGDDYLNKQGFYSLLDKFIFQNNKYDYLLTIIIDNLNFNSKHMFNFTQKLLINGSNHMKKYILDHIHCLIYFGKEIITNVKILINSLDPNFPDCNKTITEIMKLLINKNKNIHPVFKEQNIKEKVNQVDKSLLFVLMREPKIYEMLNDIINKEVDNINIDEIIDNYGNNIVASMKEHFENKDKTENKNKYYLTINLTEIKNQYNHFYEYFWIKQLPFSVVLQTIEIKEKRTEYILNNYMLYNKGHNIKIISDVQAPQKIIFDESISGIQILCLLGRITINHNCNSTNNASNFLTFSIKDIFNELMVYDIKNNLYVFKKDGINLILKEKEKNKSYFLEKIFFIIKIKPQVIIGFNTPINLITELNNNKKGYEKLIEIKAVEKLFSYLNVKDESEIDTNMLKIKSSFWILVKLILKKEFGEKIESQYNIIEKISNYFYSYNNYSMKGTILYLISCIAQNEKLRQKLKKYNFDYFFNTNIVFPIKKDSLCIDKSFQFENEKLENDVNLIEYGIKLNPISQEIYNNITNLANNITFAKSIKKIDEIFRTKNQYFSDPNLFAKIYAVLTKYKLKETTRRAILYYFDKCVISSDISLNCSQLLKSLGDNLLNAHNLSEI